jgi:hypothetical protein
MAETPAAAPLDEFLRQARDAGTFGNGCSDWPEVPIDIATAIGAEQRALHEPHASMSQR